MRFRACLALLLLLSACATSAPSPPTPADRSPRLANLRRAAGLPWRDEGRCVVREASQPWAVVVERCFHALDTRRMRFHDTEEVCPVASAGATVPAVVGICLLSQPHLAVGAVVILGAVAVAVAIQQELEAHETQEQARRPDCTPRPVPRLGGDDLHNRCADRVPRNRFPGSDVLVNGKHFDALQLDTRTLWEIKTDDFDKHSARSQRFFVRMKLPELRREAMLARECGYEFVIGVRSAEHQAALLEEAPTLRVVVMDWC